MGIRGQDTPGAHRAQVQRQEVGITDPRIDNDAEPMDWPDDQERWIAECESDKEYWTWVMDFTSEGFDEYAK